MSTSSDFNRSLSGIFSTTVFKEVAQSGNNSYFISKLKKYDSQLSLTPGKTVRKAIATAYCYLRKNYRNEYLYKNTLVNNILLGRHSVRTASVLNEFKVGNSIADIVILNGTSTVYEIKTELDTPDKLRKQLEDYKKVFAKVFLVTHHSLSDKYLQLIEGSSTGLLCLSGKFKLVTVKEAIEDYSQLNNETIMKCLRKEEYSSIVRHYAGVTPDVPNIRYFTECLKIVNQIGPDILHEMMLKQLRKRTPVESSYLESDELPKELKHICLCINPTQKEYANLFTFLNLNL